MPYPGNNEWDSASKNMILEDQYKEQETPQDRARQDEILDAFCDGMDATYNTSMSFSYHDAEILRNGMPEAIAEVKHRNCAFGKYMDYTIDKSKLKNLVKVAGNRNLNPILIVGFYSENLLDIRWTIIDPSLNYPTSIQKRRGRDELPDLVCHIPWSDFK